MPIRSEHTIAFSGLKDGRHDFHYAVGAPFFQDRSDEEVHDADLRVTVELDKSPNMLVTLIHVSGTVQVDCDHCNTPLDFPLEGDQRQIFRFTGEDPDSDDEEIVGLDPHAHEVDLGHYIYECVRLALPIRRVHAPGQCDPEVELSNEPASPNEDTDAPDPRWKALEALKDQRS